MERRHIRRWDIYRKATYTERKQIEKGHTEWRYTGRGDTHQKGTYEERTYTGKGQMSKGQTWRGKILRSRDTLISGNINKWRYNW